jgi:YHS domain-containing protein
MMMKSPTSSTAVTTALGGGAALAQAASERTRGEWLAPLAVGRRNPCLGHWLRVTTRGALVAALFAAAAADAQVLRNASQYNLEAGTALKGYDPVSYFPEGGAQPRQGDASLAASYRGVNYAFASPAHREIFFQSPERYEPTYGGWCAFAMASGMKVEIDPILFTRHGNRLHFFVSPRAKALFDADVARYESRADEHWRRISGEEPRQ